MVELTENEKKALKILFTDFSNSYNSNNLRPKLGVSNAGSLKLLRNMEKKNILVSNKMGKAIFYKPNFQNNYVIKLLELIFLDHSSLPNFVKGWISDLREFNSITKAVFLFGSVLWKGKEAGDIDVCFIIGDAKDYQKIQTKVDSINKKSRLKIQPLYLTEKEFETKLREKDGVLIDLVRNCIVVHGNELFVGVLKNVQS